MKVCYCSDTFTHFFPVFARAKQTHLPGDRGKMNSAVKDILVLHLALRKLSCVIPGFLHLTVPGSGRVNISVLYSYSVAQLLVVTVFRNRRWEPLIPDRQLQAIPE